MKWPKKMEYENPNRDWTRPDDFIAGYNEAIDTCKEAMPGVKQIDKVVKDYLGVEYMNDELAQAIFNLLTGKEEK